MSEERPERHPNDRHESPPHTTGEDFPEGGAVPLRMQMLSTWEVRKVPPNCVSRLCVLTVTRLQVVRPLQSGTGSGSVVLSASMKTPHRVLRSNQINLRANGVLDVPLEWTYSLQYPHFLKRGGNVLQIRLQRRKRVGNRPLGGYKTLAIGKVDMSQVLQHSFQGEVKLLSEKVSEHLATVTVRSLSSTAVDLDRRTNEASSDEDEDDIFSDDLVERVSDSESGGEEQDPVAHEKARRFMPSTAAILRLLRRSRPFKRGHHDPVGELLEEAEGVEFRESSVAFASSPSDSDDEISGGLAPSPPRPTLSPFFGSDRCSMVSLPTSAKSAESMVRRRPEDSSLFSKKYDSLERATHIDRMNSPILSGGDDHRYDWDFARGRLWCVVEGLLGSGAVARGLEREGEVVQWVQGDKDTVLKLMSLMNTLHKEWRDRRPFTVVLVGNDALVSCAVQALVAASCSPHIIHFAIIPTAAGLMSARLSSLDDQFLEAFPLSGPWLEALQDGVDHLLGYIQSAEHSLPLPLAQAIIQRPLKELGAYEEVFLPFMCNVSIGAWEVEPAPDSTPLSPPGNISQTTVDYPEILLEFWSPRGQKSHQGSVKVRSVMVSCADSVLNVTATKDKKTKGIRIRKPKEPEAGGSIVSLTATQLICRPVTKVKAEGGVSVVVDGVEREGVSLVRLSANWEHTLNRTFSLAVTSTLDRINT